MKFIVNSDREHVKGAVIEEHQYTHVRTCGSFEEYDELFARAEGPWLSKGANHRLIPAPRWSNGVGQFVAREEPKPVRVVDIGSLEELAEFIAYYGDVSVGKSSYADVPLELKFADE